MNHKTNFLLLLGLAGFTFLLRLSPHLPNFSAIGALLFVSGQLYARNPQRPSYLLVPLTGMILSDVLLGLYDPRLMVVVYSSLAIYALLGKFSIGKTAIFSRLFLPFMGSVQFFVITNLAVWFLTPAYAKDLSGLAECFLLALPFFKGTFLSDLLLSPLFQTLPVIFKSLNSAKNSKNIQLNNA